MTSHISEIVFQLEANGIQLALSDRAENEERRLKTIAHKQAMTEERIALIKNNKEALVSYLEQVENFKEPIKSNTNQKAFPLSFQQQSLWFAYQFSPGAASYNMPLYFKISGEINADCLELALRQIIERHEGLNTVFKTQSGEQSQQEIINHTPLNLNLLDYRQYGYQQADKQLSDLVNQAINSPFDLTRESLIRVTLVRLPGKQQAVLLTFHHIVADGWSAGILLQELSAYYDEIAAENQLLLPAPPLNYVDYSSWQRQAFELGLFESERQYWLNELKDLPKCHQLPLDHSRPVEQSFSGETVSVKLKPEIVSRLKQFCRQHGATLFTGLQSTFAVLLGRYSAWQGGSPNQKGAEQREVIIGFPMANRERDELKDLIGYFVNTGVMRTDLSKGTSFSAVLKATRNKLVKHLQHQQYPFEKLVDELVEQRNLAVSPLFQIMFVYQAYSETRFAGHNVSEISPTQASAKFDLTLKATELKEGVSLDWIFNPDLFESQTIRNLAEHFEILLEKQLEAPDVDIYSLPILSERENSQHQLLIKKQFNNPVGGILEQLNYWQKNTPENTAVCYGDNSISYSEFYDQVELLAGFIKDSYQSQFGKEIGPDTLIAVSVNRSINMIVTVFAVLRVGAAYVPIEPDAPEQRQVFTFSDCRAPILLVGDSDFTLAKSVEIEHEFFRVDVNKTLSELKRLDPQKNKISDFPAHSDLVYAIYTSGTTGKPKAALIEHRSLLNLTQQKSVKDRLSQESRYYLSPSLAFDASVLAIFSAMYSGSTLCIAKKAGIDADELRQYQATHISTSSALAEILAYQHCPTLKYLSFGGDRIADEVLSKLIEKYPNVSIEYGVTEASCCNTWLDKLTEENKHSIGKPVPGNKIYLLDDNLNPVPDGVVGQISIAGLGIARGYLNRPELTQEKFVVNPGNDNEKLYLSGDLGRLDKEGNIIFCGRNDSQIKLRGFRIEPGEIENALNAHASVRQAFVMVSDNNGQFERAKLVAYVIPEKRTDEVDEAAVRQWSKSRLPEYMIPEIFVSVSHFPLNQNGKVDIAALPLPVETIHSEFVEPTSELEVVISNVWKNLLKLDEVSVEADFFRLGGDSILSIQVSSQLRELGHECSVKLLFENPTIQELACAIETQSDAPVINAEQGLLSGEFPLLPIQSWFFEQNFAMSHHWNQSFLVRVPKLSIDQLNVAIAKLVSHHDALRIRFTAEGAQQYLSDLCLPELKVFRKGESTESLTELLTEWQSQFDIYQGPLWQFAYIEDEYDDHSARLLMSFHHLIVDAVSWRILVEDLQKLIEGRELGEKSSSYRQWVGTVQLYAEQYHAELDYWQRQLPDSDGSDLSWKLKPSLAHVELSLAKQQTKHLLNDISQAYNTEINDILLTATADALCVLNNNTYQYFNLEGHGREPLQDDIDVSRTVGWFTTEFPVRLRGDGDWHEKLIFNKEKLRNIPNKGIGFGALKASDQRLRNYHAEIGFNYLGQLDSNVQLDSNIQSDTSAYWQITSEYSGDAVHPDNAHPHNLSINCLVIDGEFKLSLRGYFGEENLQSFAEQFQLSLNLLIEHCYQRQRQSQFWLTPNDVPEAKISPELLEELQVNNSLQAVYPATGLQQGFLYHAIEQQDDDAYRVQVMWRYQQSLNPDYLRQAWVATIAQYPALRLSFNWQEDMLQLVNHQADDGFEYHDFSQRENVADDIDALQKSDRLKSFELSRPGLFRFHCIKVTDANYVVLLTMHHAIVDGWSNPILIDSLHQHYARVSRSNEINEVLPNTFNEDRAYLQAQKWYARNLKAAADHWQDYLSEFDYANDLSVLFDSPVDLTRVSKVTDPAMAELQFTGENYTNLKSQLKRFGFSTNLVVQFVWHKLIQTYTRDQRTTVGTILSGRDIGVSGVERSIGLYINTLPLMVEWSNEQQNSTAGCDAILSKMQKDVAAMNTYSCQPLAKLQRQGEPLFHSLLVFENYPVAEKAADTDKHQLHAQFENALEKVDYPLGLLAFEQNDSLGIRLNYDAKYLSQCRAEKIIEQLNVLLCQLAENICRPHQQLSLLPETEVERHLEQVAGPQTDFPFTSIVEMFSYVAENHPQAIAVEHNQTQHQYQQLDRDSQKLACYLKQLDLGEHHFIGFCLPRCYEMTVAILAILKAGYAYVPLDPDYPEARLAYIIEDSEVGLILTLQNISSKIDVIRSLALNLDQQSLEIPSTSEAQSLVTPSPNDLAYLIYTSGSTGKPKGVMIEHQALANTICNQVTELKIDTSAKVLHSTSMSFDAGTAHLFKGLCGGAHVLLADPEQPLIDIMAEEEVTHCSLPMSLLDALPRRSLPKLKVLSGGGDKCPPALADFWSEQCCFINMYGPTEAAIIASFKKLSPGETITLGKPIDNTFALVLDSAMNLCPPGVPGELFLGGRGLARGYWQRPDLTQKAFVDNPFSQFLGKKLSGEKLYKTGDLVKWTDDFELSFLGRVDHQVKIRGFRIELGEIETAIRTCDGVKEAIVEMLKDHNNTLQLVAYVVAEEDISQQLQETLTAQLPKHMVPANYQILESMPLTVNGKIDRRALPVPHWQALSNAFSEPETELEKLLCECWQTLLNLEKVGTKDDFYQIGGDSILAIQLTSRLRENNIQCSVQDVFESRTIQQLAILIDTRTEEVQVDAEQGKLVGQFPLHPIQQWFFELDLIQPNYFNQAFLIKVPQLNLEQLTQALKMLVEHHDMLRTSFSSQGQVYLEELTIPDIYHIDASDFNDRSVYSEALQKKLSELQGEFDVINGPLWTIAYISGLDNQESRIFFAAHHLLIDAVSWRILAEDLHRFYEGNKALNKTSSYRQWQSLLEERANSETEEYHYWHEQLSDSEDGQNWSITAPQNAATQLELDVDKTQSLLSEIHGAFSTEINDVLLTALAAAVSPLIDSEQFYVTLEGHGREALSDNIDVSRTVGWFTSAYPVKLKNQGNLVDTLIETKETLRAIPDKGASFGAYKYLRQNSELRSLAKARISFNYLGQFESQSTQRDNHWTITPEVAGVTTSSENLGNPNTSLLSVNCRVNDGQLVFHLSGRITELALDKIADNLRAELTTLIEICSDRVSRGIQQFTPGDFVESQIERDRLNQLQARYPIEQIFPANALQQGLVYHALQYPDDIAYRVQASWDYDGHFDQKVYKDAWQMAVNQFPSLRMAFDWQGPLLQVIARSVEIKWQDIDLSGEAEQIEKYTQLKKLELSKPFALNDPGLMRITCVRFNPQKVTIIKTEHHSIGDGWSGPVLLSRVHNIYLALMKGQRPVETKDLSYFKAQQYYFKNRDQCRGYWQALLRDEQTDQRLRLNDLGLMVDKPRGLAQHQLAEKVDEVIWHSTLDEYSRLDQCLKSHGVTMHAVIQFAWHKLIQIYTGDTHTLVGTTVSGRDISVAEIDKSVGLFINTLPLLVVWDNSSQVSEIVEQIQRRVTDMNRYAYQPLAEIQPDGQRLFQSLLVFENYPMPTKRAESSEFELTARFHPTVEKTNYPLGLVGFERDSRLGVKLQFDSQILGSESAHRLLDQLVSIIKQIPEKWQLSHSLVEFGDVELSILKSESAKFSVSAMHRYFENYADLQPEAIALVCGTQKLSYAELNRRANGLAADMLNRGIKKGDVVGIYLTRNVSVVVAMIATLKAGAAYLPIDSDLPQERVSYMIEDANPQLLISESDVLKSREVSDLPELNYGLIEIDNEKWIESCANFDRQQSDRQQSELIQRELPKVGLDDLAYIIYTSGTTGKPKGVAVNHRGPVSLLNYDGGMWRLAKNSRVLHAVNFAFDAATQVLFSPLSHGAQVHLVAPTSQLTEYIESHDITHFCSPVGLLQAQAYRELPKLETVVVGGDRCDTEVVETWGKNRRLLNVYGPTEASIVTSYKTLVAGENITLGRPIAGTEVYVVDGNNRLLPKGVPGELVIGGEGIAVGYLNRSTLNERAFQIHDFSAGKKVYHSGDRALINGANEIVFLGRQDSQVKIRGYRVELNEIESLCLQEERVSQAKVVVKKYDGRELLVAYLVCVDNHESSGKRDGHDSDDHKILFAKLKKLLQRNLPVYMQPTHWEILEQLPLTSNGKIDEKALPDPKLVEQKYVAPGTTQEKGMCAIWQQVLKVEQVGLTDDFYELGGHSLLAISLLAEIKQQMSVSLSLNQLIESSSPQQLIELINNDIELTGEPLKNLSSMVRSSEKSPVEFQRQKIYLVPAAGLTTMSYHKLAEALLDEALPDKAELHVFEPENLVKKFGLPDTIVEMAQSHVDLMLPGVISNQALSNQSDQGTEKITLIGHSFGGCIAFEMMHILKASNIEVELILLESRLDAGDFAKAKQHQQDELESGNDLFVAQQKMMASYQISRPLDASLGCLVTEDSLTMVNKNQLELVDLEQIKRNYQSFCRGEVSVKQVSGGHLSCLAGEHADSLAKAIVGRQLG
ncbi:non-ribosomal peptide synthetase [Aliikangiella coralliicola]|uniref:Amino acid adenylation domain-containing protein n=1 Tax=Aliikangiella coralliicola TaxID=2592383 RepID=A0A545UCB7_9GAMM|nr:non-ribosomal peptide synthetase [Aliikangiella coralliicola]TQV87106.1 amino acid adenylation domain-containing protein [Aliikangiella coralliicola]